MWLYNVCQWIRQHTHHTHAQLCTDNKGIFKQPPKREEKEDFDLCRVTSDVMITLVFLARVKAQFFYLLQPGICLLTYLFLNSVMQPLLGNYFKAQRNKNTSVNKMKSVSQPKHRFGYMCVCADDSVCGCGPTHTLCRCVSSVQLHYSAATVTHWKSKNPGGGGRHDICRLLLLTFWPQGGSWGYRPTVQTIAVKHHASEAAARLKLRRSDLLRTIFHEGIKQEFRERRVPSLTGNMCWGC